MDILWGVSPSVGPGLSLAPWISLTHQNESACISAVVALDRWLPPTKYGHLSHLSLLALLGPCLPSVAVTNHLLSGPVGPPDLVIKESVWKANSYHITSFKNTFYTFFVTFQFFALCMIPVPHCPPLQTQNNKQTKPTKPFHGSMLHIVEVQTFWSGI